MFIFQKISLGAWPEMKVFIKAGSYTEKLIGK